ncbi:heat shock protein 68-like protein, partial [Leptotrombidium deliense]
MVTIAIDFGYSAIRVAIFNDFNEDEVPKAEVLPNDLGDRATPTVIAIDDQTRLVGVDAITHSALNPHNAVYGIKRIIGRSESDVVFKQQRNRYSFIHHVSNERLKCLFTKNDKIEDDESFTESSVEERTFEELLAFIFHKIKENAELELQAINPDCKS